MSENLKPAAFRFRPVALRGQEAAWKYIGNPPPMGIVAPTRDSRFDIESLYTEDHLCAPMKMIDTLRWLAALVQSKFDDQHTVSIDGAKRIVGDLLDDADALLGQGLHSAMPALSAVTAERDRLAGELATVKKVAYGNLDLLEENYQLRAEVELWQAAARLSASRLSGMLAAAQYGMTPETIHEVHELHHHVLAGTPDKIEWLAALAAKEG